ncbi:MAG TPA: hypothetical protein DCK76_11965 [Desulfotomaculum sp.]|nr:hypothetical protein [Desulfotomaculum sp.]HBY04196.1 hypothetical protein [Desulfotomaculum sp.]
MSSPKKNNAPRYPRPLPATNSTKVHNAPEEGSDQPNDKRHVSGQPGKRLAGCFVNCLNKNSPDKTWPAVGQEQALFIKASF